MIRMDDAASISLEERPRVDLIPNRVKFWHQMAPWAGKDYLFSTDWSSMEGKPDSLQEILGDVGNWQVIVVVLMMMFNIPSVFHVASPEVTSTINDFWCHKVAKNLTVEQWKTLSSVKRVNFRGQEVVDPCYIKDLPYESVPYEDLMYMASSGDLPCYAWDYNASRITVVSQFNLACSRLPVNNAAESVFSLGAGVGGLITAFMADRYGRRKVLMPSQGIVVVLGFLIANVSSYSAFLFVRTIMGAACSAVLLSSMILCIEIIGGRWQDILSIVYTFSYSLAYMILYLTNKLFDSWIYLQYSITLITIFLLSIWWLVPESPRWLLTVQNIPRLMIVLEMASSFNRRALPAGTSTMMKNLRNNLPNNTSTFVQVAKVPINKIQKIHHFSNEIISENTQLDFTQPFVIIMRCSLAMISGPDLYIIVIYAEGVSIQMAPMQVEFKKPTMGMLFRGPAIRRLSIVAPFVCFFCSLTYFGLVLNNDLFNYGLFFSGVVEFLAGAVVLLMGIKNSVKMVAITNAMSGICCLIAAGLTKSVYLDIVCTAARFFGGMSNCCSQTVLTTMYPTLIRTMALGWANFYANMALAVAANIVLLSELSGYLPLIILGMSGLLGSFFMLFLPGKVCRDILDLPEEIEYGHENIAEQRSKNPRAKIVPPKWIPQPPVDNLIREPSVTRETNADPFGRKPDRRVTLEDGNVGVGEAGPVDPDDIVIKSKSPLWNKSLTSSEPRTTDEKLHVETKRKRRWYFLFIC